MRFTPNTPSRNVNQKLLSNIDTAKRCKLHPYGMSLTLNISKEDVRSGIDTPPIHPPHPKGCEGCIGGVRSVTKGVLNLRC